MVFGRREMFSFMNEADLPDFGLAHGRARRGIENGVHAAAKNRGVSASPAMPTNIRARVGPPPIYPEANGPSPCQLDLS